MNIVFGEKGSGKTVLLKDYILRYFESEGKKTFLHEGKDYSVKYEDIVKELEDSVNIDEEKITKSKDIVEKILNYKEEMINFIEQSIEHHENLSELKNRKKLKKADSSYSVLETYTYKELIDEFTSNEKSIAEVLTINNSILRDQNRKNELNIELGHLKHDLKYNFKNEYKKLYTSQNIDKFLRNLKTSANKNSGSKSKPITSGFANLVSKRLDLLKNSIVLKNNLISFENTRDKKMGELPGKGDVYLRVNIEVMDKDSRATSGGFNRSRITSNRQLIGKLFSLSVNELKNINKYFDELEKSIDVDQFFEDIVIKTSKVTINSNDNYKPSEGEQAILSITGILENFNYDVYIFDEIERGLGNRFITDYVILQINKLIHAGKTVILSTHNANLAINSLPINFVYCNYIDDISEIYYYGNMFNNELIGIKTKEKVEWEEKALLHLEGSDEMFKRRKNIYGI